MHLWFFYNKKSFITLSLLLWCLTSWAKLWLDFQLASRRTPALIQSKQCITLLIFGRLAWMISTRVRTLQLMQQNTPQVRFCENRIQYRQRLLSLTPNWMTSKKFSTPEVISSYVSDWVATFIRIRCRDTHSSILASRDWNFRLKSQCGFRPIEGVVGRKFISWRWKNQGNWY